MNKLPQPSTQKIADAINKFLVPALLKETQLKGEKSA